MVVACPHTTLVARLVGLIDPERRTASARDLAAWLGAEAVVIFTADPELGVLLPAAGFPQTLPSSEWRLFVDACRDTGEEAGLLPRIADRTLVTARGRRIDDCSVLVVLGGSPSPRDLDALVQLLPLVTGAYRVELDAAAASARAAVESGVAHRASGLAAALDRARRTLAEEVRERERREEELRARVEFEEQLAGIVSHDLRNPISVVLTGAGLLLRRDDLDEDVQRIVARIQSSGERADRMIRDLLDFTRTRFGGGIPVHPEPMDFHAVAEQIVEEVAVAFPTRSIRLTRGGDGRGVWDSDRIAQVLANLLRNAVQYSPEWTAVRVAVDGVRDKVVVRVENDGPPISPDLIPRIFEPMQRGAALEGRRTHGGLGLGLHIVREIVRAHDGTVEVESSREGGTAFIVTLPRGSSSAQEQATWREAASG